MTSFMLYLKVVVRFARGLEPALRNDQDVARLHVDIGGDVAALHQIAQADGVQLSTFRRTKDAAVVAIGEVGESADGDHHVENRHVLAIREHGGLSGLADDAYLLSYGT